MSDQPAINVKVQVTAMSAHHKMPPPGFMTPMPPNRVRLPEIDPDYVSLSFVLLENKGAEMNIGTLMLKTEDAKKMGLMIGDKLTIKLTKDNQ